MKKITCACGYSVEGKDHYEAEAKAWHHAIKDHLEMLKGMSVDDLMGVIKNTDEQMAS